MNTETLCHILKINVFSKHDFIKIREYFSSHFGKYSEINFNLKIF